jgi:surfeit locus 1 family protein
VSWRFVVRPKWIVRHVAVVVLVVVMVMLGLWQLRRLDEKRDYKALVEARQEEPVAAVGEVVPAGVAVDAPGVDAVLYRTVTATGAYEDDDTVVVENRTYNGAAGGWVLTPLRLDEGTAVVVNRGFVGFDREGAIVPPPAPTGEVTVEGLVFPSQQRGRFGPTDPVEGDLGVLARVDLDRFAAQVDYDVLPAYIQLVASEPPEGAPADGAPALVPLGAPIPEEGPHLSYAVQWFIFSTIAAGGYVLLLRRVARDQATEEAGAAADLARDDVPANRT